MKAKIAIAAVYATCPYCGGQLVDLDGSLMIIPILPTTTYRCIECEKESLLSAKAYSRHA